MQSKPGPAASPPVRLTPKPWILRPKLDTSPLIGPAGSLLRAPVLEIANDDAPPPGRLNPPSPEPPASEPPHEEPSQPAGESAPASWVTTSNPLEATKEAPFLNSSGMLFVPVPLYKTLFSMCLVRLCDYTLYCQAKKLPIPDCDFPQGPDHPVVNLTWHDATKFCEWLTKKEQDEKILPADLLYRLPTDLEWSAAVGLPHEPQGSPKARSGKAEGYPWGISFPPPLGSGNYSPILRVDEFRETSPVASFPANEFGICDLGGNVWEWCSDQFSPPEETHVARGAACFNDSEEYLRSSHRDSIAPTKSRNNLGFRVVLSGGIYKDPLHRVHYNPWA
ncbi:MAG: SUMF1/EgtB/PvdO family nonheme iron enzyme [Terrimicrobiaceae bacterium]